jgi:hypothetical protein
MELAIGVVAIIARQLWRGRQQGPHGLERTIGAMAVILI